METRNQAKKSTAFSKTSNKSASAPHNVADLSANRNVPFQLKKSDNLQTSRYTPPSQRREEVAKRKKDADEAKQKELEETNKKKRRLESAKDLTPYQKKLEEAKEQAISQGKFKASCCSRRDDGTIQLEGVLRGCSPFALEFEVSDDQHDEVRSTHQSVNINPSQSSTADCTTSNVDQNPVGIRSMTPDPTPSQETAKVVTQSIESPYVAKESLQPLNQGLVTPTVIAETQLDTTSVIRTEVNPIPTELAPTLASVDVQGNPVSREKSNDRLRVVTPSALTINVAPDPLPLIVETSIPNQVLAPVPSLLVEALVRNQSPDPAPSLGVEASVTSQNLAPVLSLVSETLVQIPVPPVVVETLAQIQNPAPTQNQNRAPVSPLVGGEANENSRIKKTRDLHEEMLMLDDTILALGMLDHHVSFVEDCIREMVYPLGLKAFVPCAVFRSNNALKKEWKKILHATSTELLALCRMHYRRTEVAIMKDLAELKLKGESLKGEDRIKWEMRECNAWRESEVRSKKLNERRKKKLKHTQRVHMEGRIFTEHCLVEHPVAEHVQERNVATEKTASSNQDVLRENDVSEVVHVQERNVAKDKTASSNQDVLGENDVSEVEKSPARTVTLAVGENSVLVNQSHSRSTNVGTVQCTESSCIPPNAETSLPESNEPPPPASSHRNNDVLQPSNTHPLNKVPPAPHNVCRVEVRPVRKFRWLPYGNYNVRHPYWEAICWEKYQRQNRSNHWTNHPTDYRYRRKPWEYVPQRFYGRNQYF